MYSQDENSGPSIRKGKRRSSILKVPKSPGCALDDIDPNTENVDENDVRSKKARRSSSRRVSFAETCQIKEIPNKVLDKMNEDEFAINEDNHAPPSFLNLESTGDDSAYRQPAPTLAGLPSLLTSPIQESPNRPNVPQFSSDHDENQLDFTCCQPSCGIQDNANKTQDAMEMTKNYEGWEFEQSTVLTSRYSISNKCSEDDGQLDFTRTHGAYNFQDNKHNTTVPEDMMEMTRNYEGWEFEHATVLTRQVVASKVAISNQGQISKPKALNFLDQLQDNEPNESFGRRNSYDKVQTSRTVQSPKRDGASFLNKLRSNDNPSFQPQQPRAMYSNRSFPVEAHSTTLPMMASLVQSPVRDGSSFLSQLKASSNNSKYQQQENCMNNNPAFTNAPSSHYTTTYIPEKDDDLEFTCCQPANIDSSQFQTVDEDITVNMEMTTNYENWQLEKPNQNLKTPKNDDSLHFVNKRSPEKDDDYLEFTRCHGQIEKSRVPGDGDVDGNDMEMTSNYENWEKSSVASASRNECNVHAGNKHSPGKENLDFTRCQPGNIFETSKFQDVDEDVTADEMEMTRSYENWQREKSNVLSVQQEASKNVDNFVEKAPQDVAPDRLGEILDHTANKTFDAVITSKPSDIQTSIPMVNASRPSDIQISMPMVDASRPSDVQTFMPMVNAARPSHIQISMSTVNASRPSDIQTSMPMVNASRLQEMCGNQSTSANVSRLGKPSEIQTRTAKANSSRLERENEMCMPKVARHENISESQKSMLNSSRCIIEASESQTSMLDSKKPLEPLEDQANLVKAIPRATSSKIIMDDNFKRFEIKMPTSKVSKASVFKSKEKPQEVKLEEKFPEIKSEEKFPGMKSEEKFPGMESEEKCLGLKFEGKFPGIKAEESKPGIEGQEPLLCPQDLSSTNRQLNDDISRSEENLDIETLPTVEDSTTVMNVSTKLIHSNDTTTTETEDIEKDGPKFKNETILEEKETDQIQKPYTLREFMADAGISFLQYKTRRSETPMLKCDVPKELKDKIYCRCLSEAKLQIMEDFALLLQQEITENEKLFAAKEKELDENNPPVFSKLKNVLGTEDEDLVVDVIKQLKRTGDTRGKRLWYIKKTQMNNNILASLQEQEKKVFSDLTLLNNHKSDLDEDINMLDKLEADCDKQIQELEGTLDSEEKEWAEFVRETNELTQKLEKLELELKSKEEQRAHLSSVKETLSSEIAEQRRKMTDVESVIKRLEEDKALRESKDAEMRKLLPFQTALQEWVLEKYDKTEFKFTFLGRTLDLDVTFKDEEKIKDIQLISQISETSIPLAILCHSLVMEQFAHYDFVAMFPTRKKLRQLLHQVSLVCVRVRILLETMSDFSINHYVSVNDKILTVEFSSLAKFLKFIINFDLSELVAEGNIPFTVVRKIGATSAEAITEKLNKFPSTVTYFSKILEAADQMMR